VSLVFLQIAGLHPFLQNRVQILFYHIAINVVPLVILLCQKLVYHWFVVFLNFDIHGVQVVFNLLELGSVRVYPEHSLVHIYVEVGVEHGTEFGVWAAQVEYPGDVVQFNHEDPPQPDVIRLGLEFFVPLAPRQQVFADLHDFRWGGLARLLQLVHEHLWTRHGGPGRPEGLHEVMFDQVELEHVAEVVHDHFEVSLERDGQNLWVHLEIQFVLFLCIVGVAGFELEDRIEYID